MGFRVGMRRLLAAAMWAGVVLGTQALARPLLQLDLANQPVTLQQAGEAWIDSTGAATALQVASGADIAWRPTRPDTIYPLAAGKALWIRFRVPAATGVERWYVEIPYPAVDLVTLYTPTGPGAWSAQSAGDTLPIASWPMPHRHPLLPVAVSPGGPREFLLRVENPNNFSAPLSFVSEGYVIRSEQRMSLILGMYFGLAALGVALGLAGALSLRDSAFGLYAFSVALMGLTQASITGIAGLHLWPHQVWWNGVAATVLPALVVGSQIWFFSILMAMPTRSPRLHRLLMGLALLSIVVAIAVMLIDPARRVNLLGPYIIVAVTVGIAAIVWAARRGDRQGGWVLVSLLLLVAGAAFPLARLAGLIPVGFLSQHAMQIGIAIELPLVLAILMRRSQQRREHNRRIQGLDRLDPATGLINAHVFEIRLARMMARSQRLHHQSAVLLIDIANIEQVRRELGHRMAGELPLRVAGRLLTASREIDSVARLSEHRFGMLVEGPLSPEEASSVGPRVVARCLMPFKDKPEAFVARLRVAQTLVPLDSNGSAVRIVGQLETLLAAVPAKSKRAVFSLRKELSGAAAPGF